MNMPTQPQIISFGRHIVSYAMGAVTMFAALHIISAGDAQNIANSISQISDGMAKILAAIGPLIATLSGIYAAWKASPWSQLLSVAKQANDPNSPVQAVVVSDTPEGKALAAAATQATASPAVVVTAGTPSAVTAASG